MIREDKLDFWLRQRCNVLFLGRHGVGKTALVKAAFERAGLVHGSTWLYFSAATLDPWVDLVGVPRERIGEDGAAYLDLVRPRALAEGKVEAVFFDEFNRAPKKVRNAVMELLQFKSINGKEFPNLKVVWAAANPDDANEYDVDRIDPAQADRFHVVVEVPYKPSLDWFTRRYGDHLARAALGWWDGLPEAEKKKVSPRRLEYALSVYAAQGDLRDVLPVSCNCAKLLHLLNNGTGEEKLVEFVRARDTAAARLFLSNENYYTCAIGSITRNDSWMDFFLPLLSKEKLAALMASHDRACDFICSRSGKYPPFQEVMKEILHANQNKKLARRVRKALTGELVLAASFLGAGGKTPAPPHFNRQPASDIPWRIQLEQLRQEPLSSALQRLKLYQQVAANLPEHLPSEEALATLELLDAVVSRCWTSTVAGADMGLLVNLVNHCLAELARNDRLDWFAIVTRHGARFRFLLEKIKEAGLAGQMLTPTG